MQQQHPDKSINWANMVKLILIYTAINNCYQITIYNVTKFDGNKFVNGMIFGAADLSSGIVAGLLISKTSPKVALLTCTSFSIVFNALS